MLLGVGLSLAGLWTGTIAITQPQKGPETALFIVEVGGFKIVETEVSTASGVRDHRNRREDEGKIAVKDS